MFRIGKSKENLIVRDACILSARAKSNSSDFENYNNFLNFVEGSQNGRAMVMFLKAYPDAYREDEVAREVVDRYIAHNGESAYAIHGKALIEYSKSKDSFERVANNDILSVISLKNKYLKEAEQYGIAKNEARTGAFSPEYLNFLQEAQKKSFKNCGALEIMLNTSGKFIEGEFKDAAWAYERLSEMQDKKDALVSKAESVAIKASLGLASMAEIMAVDKKLMKEGVKKTTIENQYNAIAFETEVGATNLSPAQVRDVFGMMGSLEDISEKGFECIKLGETLIASQEDFISEQ